MPAVKQGGGYTLTFAKKNLDVKEKLDELKKNKVVITDYICEAIRFYEQNKDKNLNSNAIDSLMLDKMIEDKIKLLMENNFTKNDESSVPNLEDNLDCVSDSDLEED